MDAPPPERISPNVYIGSEFTACTREHLISCNVRHLVNAGYPRATNHFSDDSGFAYLALDLNEEEGEEVYQCMQACFKFMGEFV